MTEEQNTPPITPNINDKPQTIDGGTDFVSLDALIQETGTEKNDTSEEDIDSSIEQMIEKKVDPHIIYHAHSDKDSRPIDANVPRFRPETSKKSKKIAPKARVEIPEE